jgi:ribosomal protein S18 acetylase RimI-like enzyme
MTNQKITIEKLNEDRWQDYRDLRLEALKSEPIAFSSSYEEEQSIPENSWRERINNNLFVMADNKPVGLAGFFRNTHLKTHHVCEMYGVYLRSEYRGQGIGKRLVEAVMAEIQRLKGVTIIEVGVNPTQKAAKNLYRKRGFKTVAHFNKWMCIDGKFYDALIMEKHL